ncbi:MAG: DnaA ATPase domain-containing protein [Gemmatimonadales bacterium]
MTVDLNPRFSFDSFVVGPANRLAATAARAVAESPGATYNPLLIHGGSGLGKTHLLMAIGQKARNLAPDVTVEYVTLDEFAEGFNAAAAAGQTDAFRRRFAEVTVLLVDDLQFLAHRTDLQIELQRITKDLHARGRQLVFATDRPPDEIEDLHAGLVEHFDGGLVVDVGPPDLETRRSILMHAAVERNAALGDEVLEAAAQVDVANVRELMGLLNRLVAFQAVSEEPLTAGSARSVLEGQGQLRPTRPVKAVREVEAAEPESAKDEFADFLMDVSSTVQQQIDAWRSTIGEAIMRWEGEGYRTARLEALLQEDVPSEHAIRDYERGVEVLKHLQATMRAIDPDRAEDPAFYDPDRVDDAKSLVEEATHDISPPPGPSPAWTMEGLVEGEVNRVAVRAARAVVEQPAVRYNPLVLVGPTGVGKTHLMHAVGHGLAATSTAVVACLSAQQFLEEIAQAASASKIAIWRSHYRRVGAFLLDDVHLLAGDDRAQEELFHLYNALLEANRQLVLTLNALPAAVGGLEERLVSRFEGGLVAEIMPPDRELRRAIVIKKLEERVGAAEEELADYLAARPADSVRAVLGLVQRLVSAAEAKGVMPDAALARDMIEGAVPARRRSSVAVRTSGILVSPVGGVKSREKTVWYWPDPAERVIEELA